MEKGEQSPQYQKYRQNNEDAVKEHLAVKLDRKGLARRYFEFVSQLKGVLNPNEVQKHVEHEVNKTYNYAKKKQKGRQNK
ncbi:hypothetical protein [Zhouia amylolytica]|uniref:hypothetical protein n=1 Tax=Zhouia amylolytica TaxID=376730 RepID=UPI0020CF5BC1|nr:hypothetical protein [Zhouia amylolytica]MCQ0110528.1 hypothetical protein [Zhouia amylolytica]